MKQKTLCIVMMTDWMTGNEVLELEGGDLDGMGGVFHFSSIRSSNACGK
jgi:hypothetical protein